MRKCSAIINGIPCERKHYGQGLCRIHRYQLTHHRELTEIDETYFDSEERYKKLKASLKEGIGGCLEWTGPGGGQGYGQVCVASEKVSAHRYFWIHERGNIPSNREIDHICNNRRCCNVEHLQLLPGKLNVHRIYGHEVFATENPNVFEYDGSYIYYSDLYRNWDYVDDPSAYGIVA